MKKRFSRPAVAKENDSPKTNDVDEQGAPGYTEGYAEPSKEPDGGRLGRAKIGMVVYDVDVADVHAIEMISAVLSLHEGTHDSE
jgi:hypothetical protein